MENIPSNIEEYWVVIHTDRKPADAHRSWFNAPTSNEVALVIVGQVFEKWDIVVHSRDAKWISEVHRSYDALQYPLIFCCGENGYYINILQRDPNIKVPLKKTVSASYFYHIMQQEGHENYLLHCHSLLNQHLNYH